MPRRNSCKLPSEQLTGKAKAEYTKNGPCKTTNLMDPISLEAFEKEDRYKQLARCRIIGSRTGWSITSLAEHLGTSENHANQILSRLGLVAEFAANEAEVKARSAFLPDGTAAPMDFAAFERLRDDEKADVCLLLGSAYGWTPHSLACALNTSTRNASKILEELELVERFKKENSNTTSLKKLDQRRRRALETSRVDPDDSADASQTPKKTQAPVDTSSTITVITEDPLYSDDGPFRIRHHGEFLRCTAQERTALLKAWGSYYGWNAKMVTDVLGVSAAQAKEILDAHECTALFRENRAKMTGVGLKEQLLHRNAAIERRKARETENPELRRLALKTRGKADPSVSKGNNDHSVGQKRSVREDSPVSAETLAQSRLPAHTPTIQSAQQGHEQDDALHLRVNTKKTGAALAAQLRGIADMLEQNVEYIFKLDIVNR